MCGLGSDLMSELSYLVKTELKDDTRYIPVQR